MTKSLSAPIAFDLSECRTTEPLIVARTILDFRIDLSIRCTGIHTIWRSLGNPMNSSSPPHLLSYLPYSSRLHLVVAEVAATPSRLLQR